MAKIKDSTKVRVIIQGVCLMTTAGLLRCGTISSTLFAAWLGFEAEHVASGITGKLGRYRDVHMGRDVDIQFDLY